MNSMKRCDHAGRIECKGRKCKGKCENENVNVVINEVPVPLFKLNEAKNLKASRQKGAKVYVSLLLCCEVGFSKVSLDEVRYCQAQLA